MRAVNLLPRDTDVVRSAGKAKLALAAAGGIAAVTVLAGVLGMSASGQVDEQRASLELTEAAIARIPARDQGPVLPDMSSERSNRLAALQSALSTRTPVDAVMTQLAYVVPEDVWLNGLTVTIPSDAATNPPAGQAPGATPTAATVTVKGATFSQASIARFLARLNALSSLENVRLTESSRVEPQSDGAEGESGKAKAKSKPKKQKVVVTFTVTADLHQGLTS
jgi:Tfp pilus assembly protein PilN